MRPTLTGRAVQEKGGSRFRRRRSRSVSVVDAGYNRLGHIHVRLAQHPGEQLRRRCGRSRGSALDCALSQVLDRPSGAVEVYGLRSAVLLALPVPDPLDQLDAGLVLGATLLVALHVSEHAVVVVGYKCVDRGVRAVDRRDQYAGLLELATLEQVVRRHVVHPQDCPRTITSLVGGTQSSGLRSGESAVIATLLKDRQLPAQVVDLLLERV